MGVELITGKVGSGKSLLALTQALKILADGRCVVSNMALNEAEVDRELRRTYRRDLFPGQLRYHDFEEKPDFHNHIPFGIFGHNVHVFVDEAQLFYNSANDTALKKELLKLVSFLTQSRKCCVDITFITQADDTIWRQFRLQCLYGYKCRDMRSVAFPIIGPVPLLMGLGWAKYDVMTGETLKRGHTPLSRRLFRLYDTRQMFDSQMRELMKTAEIWHPVPRKRGKENHETDSDSAGSGRRGDVRGGEDRELLRGEDAPGPCSDEAGDDVDGSGPALEGGWFPRSTESDGG